MKIGLIVGMILAAWNVAMAGNLLKNGDFEQLDSKTNFPIGWNAGSYSGAEGSILTEKDNVGGGR